MTTTSEVRRAAAWWLAKAVAADNVLRVKLLATLAVGWKEALGWYWAARAQREQEVTGDCPQEEMRRDRPLGMTNFILSNCILCRYFSRFSSSLSFPNVFTDVLGFLFGRRASFPLGFSTETIQPKKKRQRQRRLEYCNTVM
jgi:hypothetical protein